MKYFLVFFCLAGFLPSVGSASVKYPLPEVGGLDFVRADGLASALAVAEAEKRSPVPALSRMMPLLLAQRIPRVVVSPVPT